MLSNLSSHFEDQVTGRHASPAIAPSGDPAQENFDANWARYPTGSSSEKTFNLSAEQYRLRDAIAPLDSYTEDGTYWGDLPRWKRVCILNNDPICPLG